MIGELEILLTYYQKRGRIVLPESSGIVKRTALDTRLSAA
jgi:hypothetical protein